VKRAVTVALMVALVLALSASMVLANSLNGGPRNDTIFGNSGGDTLNGKGGDDKLFGKGGRDLIICGSGDKDYANGGNGSDIARPDCERVVSAVVQAE
jgi:Ca2+-binding RTX toxin-like protein